MTANAKVIYKRKDGTAGKIKDQTGNGEKVKLFTIRELPKPWWGVWFDGHELGIETLMTIDTLATDSITKIKKYWTRIKKPLEKPETRAGRDIRGSNVGSMSVRKASTFPFILQDPEILLPVTPAPASCCSSDLRPNLESTFLASLCHLSAASYGSPPTFQLPGPYSLCLLLGNLWSMACDSAPLWH